MNLSRASIPDLATLQAFEAAARHGNFTKAAAELNLTQSAISRQIQALEVQLGVVLFERVRKRVHLSVTGRQILPDVQRILSQLEDLTIKARAAGDGGGTLTVACLPTFGNRWLMPRLPHFLGAHPGLSVSVISRSAPFDLRGEGIDLAIHYGQPVWASATCTYMCSEVILPVAAPSLLDKREVAAPQNLDSVPLLHLTTRPKLWAEWFQRYGTENENAYRGSRFDQFSMIIEAALRGLGVALLPSYLIENELDAGSLRIAFDLPLTTENNYYVVLPEGGRENRLARTFQDWMLSLVGKPMPVDVPEGQP